MPTLFRFLAAVTALAGVVFGVALILAGTVEPQPREIVITIPPSKLVGR